MPLEQVGGVVAKEVHGVAALDQGEALGYEAFELHRADFRAVLLLLAALLDDFVVVKLAEHTVNGAMEDVDCRPEQVFEVGLEASVCERGDQRIEDVGDGPADDTGFGERPWVRLVLEGTIGVQM
jgi:hypothetical protein